MDDRNDQGIADDRNNGERPLGSLHRPLSQVVADAIRQSIVDGEFKPGMRLVEDRLAVRFGVSRNPVREAVRSLAAEGLITIVPRHGAVVAELSPDEIRETIEVRATLEGMNARLAARHCDKAVVRYLHEILEAGLAAVRDGRVDALPSLNAQFHDTLGSAGSNRVLTDLLRLLRERTGHFFPTGGADHAVKTWNEHAEILNAVMAGDEDLACLLAQRHVKSAEPAPDE